VSGAISICGFVPPNANYTVALAVGNAWATPNEIVPVPFAHDADWLKALLRGYDSL
jgi:hypothetical protein